MLCGNESTMPQTLPQPEKRTFLVVDDHAMVLGGTLNILKQEYPEADILTAATNQLCPRLYLNRRNEHF